MTLGHSFMPLTTTACISETMIKFMVETTETIFSIGRDLQDSAEGKLRKSMYCGCSVI